MKCIDVNDELSDEELYNELKYFKGEKKSMNYMQKRTKKFVVMERTKRKKIHVICASLIRPMPPNQSNICHVCILPISPIFWSRRE